MFGAKKEEEEARKQETAKKEEEEARKQEKAVDWKFWVGPALTIGAVIITYILSQGAMQQKLTDISDNLKMLSSRIDRVDSRLDSFVQQLLDLTKEVYLLKR